MSKHDFTIGIEIRNGNKEGIEKLIEKVSSEAGLIVFRIDERVVVSSENKSFDEELINKVEELAFDLGIDDTQIELVYVDMDSSKIIESQSAELEFMREYDVDEDELTISNFPELVEFIREYKASIDNEISTYESLALDSKEKSLKEEQKISDKVDKETEEGFTDNVDFNTTGNNNKETEEGFTDKVNSNITGNSEEKTEDVSSEFQELINSLESPIEKEKVQVNTSEVIHSVKPNNESEVYEDSLISENNSEDQNVDPLMKIAIQLFTKQHLKQLPTFDELTQRELQKEIVTASFSAEQAKQESVLSIFNRLKQQEEFLLEEIDQNVLSQAKQVHEVAIEKHQKNLEVDKQEVRRKRSEDYNQRKLKFVEEQKTALETKFDAENLHDFQTELNLTIDNLEREAERAILEENKRFEDYRNTVINEQKQNMVENFDISAEVEKYNSTVDSEQNVLSKEAEEFKGQIGQATLEIQRDNEVLLRQVNELKSQAHIQKETEEQRIKSSVSMSMSDMKRENEKYEADIKENFERELEKLKKQISDKEQELIKERKNNLSINEALDSKKREIEAMKYARTQVMNDASGYEIQSPVIQKTQTNENDSLIKFQKRVIGFGAGLVALLFIAIGIAVYSITSSHSSNQASTPSTTAGANSSSQETTSSSFEVGKTYPYTASNGEKVKLIIDDAQSGHYVDKDGKFHSVLLVN